MMLVTLADAFRSAGVPHTEEPGWLSRGLGQMSAVRTITIHHTAGGNDSSDLRVVRDGRTGLPGPLAHILLRTDGTPHVVASGLCAHAGVSRAEDYRNPYAVGIEAVHDGVSPWPAAKYEGLVRTAGALVRHYGLEVSRVLGHKETCSPVGRKIDPNFDMHQFRADVAAWLDSGRVAEPAPAEPLAVTTPKAPPFPLKPGYYFGPRLPLWRVKSVSGYFSHSADLKRWQQRMQDRGWRLAVTGRYDAATERVARAFQAEKRLSPIDSLIGADTWAAAWTAPTT